MVDRGLRASACELKQMILNDFGEQCDRFRPVNRLQIVHSVREGKKVRQQVIATLGRLDLLEASGQLERLMRSGLRHCESFAVLDAHAAGEIQPVAIRRIGPDLVFARLWKECGISDVLRSLLRTCLRMHGVCWWDE